MSTNAPSERKRGRGQGRPDTEEGVGRAALIEKTIEALRETPPEALTLAGVAAKAGVHPALVRYYFGGKDGLLKAVINTLVDREQQGMRRTMDSNAPLDQKLVSRLRGMIDLVETNPHFHRLVLDKLYAQGDGKGGDGALAKVGANGLMLTVAMLHDQPQARVKPVDPRFLHVAMIGMSEFFVAATPLLKEFFGEDADMAELKERYIGFLRDMILSGVCADGGIQEKK